jgi:ArsR family transcriptional regulator
MTNKTVTDKTDIKELAELMKALADESRLTILIMLQAGEMCVCEILEALNFSQPAVSHHLKILKQAGMITDHREGKWVYYSLNTRVIKDMSRHLQRMLITPIEEGRPCQEARPHPHCHEC